MADTTDEKQLRIDAQIAEFLRNGYKREELFVTPSGNVIYDPAAAEEAASKRFDDKKSDENS